VQVLELLKNVREELQYIREMTFEVKADAKRARQWFLNWTFNMLPAGPWGISWLLLLVTPVMTVVLVGYGIPASYTKNIGLALIGRLEWAVIHSHMLMRDRNSGSESPDRCYQWAVGS
jgi:hypothetical protein